MYFVLYRTVDDSDGINTSIRTVWGDCDESHDYGVRIDFFETEHHAYSFAIHEMNPLIKDYLNACEEEEEEYFSEYERFIQKFSSILDAKSTDDLNEILLNSLKEFFKEANKLFLPVYIGVTVGYVEKS